MAEITITQEDLDKKITEAVEAATAKMAEKNVDLLGEIKNARKRVEAFKDFDPDDVRKALENAKEAQKKATDAMADRGEFEKAMGLAKDQHAAELTKLLGRAETAEARTKTMVVDTAMHAALAKAKIAEPFRAAVAAMHKGNISVIEKDGKEVAVVGDKSITEFLTEWAGTDEGKFFAADGGAGGGGASGGTGSDTGGETNPWHTDTRNLTRQGQIERDNPTLAEQLKQQAGASKAA